MVDGAGAEGGEWLIDARRKWREARDGIAFVLKVCCSAGPA